MSETITEKLPRLLYRDMRSRLETLADEAIKERVLEGIKLLDGVYGPGWVDHVDPRRLIMSSESSCVLGQVYGDYSRGLEKLNISHGKAHAFDVDDSRFFDGESRMERYSDLEDAWKRVLA